MDPATGSASERDSWWHEPAADRKFGHRRTGPPARGAPSFHLKANYYLHPNPQARNLFEIIDTLQKREGVRFEVRAMR